MNYFQTKFLQKRLYSMLILVLICGFAKAQHDTVTVITSFTPTISDAFKINLNPVISDTVKPIVISTYTTYPKLIATSYDVEPIKAAKLVDEKIPKLYKSLIKGGFGTLTTPYVELFYNSLRSKSMLFTAHFNHLSSVGQIKDFGPSGFSNNELNVYGRKFMKNHTLSFGGDYSRNVVHNYGFKPAEFIDTITKDEIKQRFNYIAGNAKINSNYLDSSKLYHSIGVKYYYLNDFKNATENSFGVNAVVSKNVKLFKNYRKQMFELTGDVDYYNFKYGLNSTNTYLVKLVPHYKLILDEYMFDVGMNTSVAGDTSADLHLYPMINVSVNLVKNMLILYTGLNPEIQKNSFKSLSDENPFIRSNLPMKFSYKTFEFTAGLKGNLSSNASFNVAYIGSHLENMALFVTDTLFPLKNKFTVVYDDVDVTNIKAEIALQKTDKFKVLLRADYFQYTTLHEIKAWHKPEMDVSLSFNYSIQNKIITRIDIFAYDKKYARIYDNHIEKAYKLDGIIDANLSVEYRYTKLLSAFVNFNNLGSSRYYQWYNYPSRRFNVLFGVSYAF